MVSHVASLLLLYLVSAISFPSVPSFAVDQVFCLSSTRSRNRLHFISYILRGSNIHLCGHEAANPTAVISTIIRITFGC
jgi:hypothetical protein